VPAAAAADEPPPAVVAPAQETPDRSISSDTDIADAGTEAIWRRVEQLLMAKHPSLAASLAGAVICRMDNDRLTIRISGSEFNLKRVQRPQSIEVLAEACSAVLQRTVSVDIAAECASPNGARRTSQENQKRKQRALRHPLVEQAVEIFKGEVVDVKLSDPEGGSR